MAPFVSADRVHSTPVSLLNDFYREEFLKHRECLARQREYYSERAITSADGATWAVQPAISASDLSALTYATQFIAVGAGGTKLTSPDGTTWTAQPSTVNANLNAIVRDAAIYGYVAVGTAGINVVAK